ncbi:hypothetical protein BVY03_04875 [bacterium K02(2017)]|nr:hypothetical protein BVY03_04875 [bacterium K02(2017)]
MDKILKILSLLFFCFSSFTVMAFPITEKLPVTGVLPLRILSSQPDFMFLPTTGDFKNKFIYVAEGDKLRLVDLETWADFHTQPESFSTTVVDVALLPNGKSIIVALANGNLARIELDDLATFENTIEVSSDSTTSNLITKFQTTTDSSDDSDTTEEVAEEEEEEDAEDDIDSRGIDINNNLTNESARFMVADPEDDFVYLVNDSGYYFEYNINNNTVSEIDLLDETATNAATTTDDDGNTSTSNVNHTPTDMLFANSSSGQKVFISTSEGKLLSITPGSNSFSEHSLSSTAVSDSTPNFAKMAVTPDGNFIYVVDTDNDVIWVFSLVSSSFVDQISSGTGLDPIEVDSDDNGTFSDIHVFEDDAALVTTYVSGDSGITLIDADNPGTAEEDKVIDASSTSASTEDPITLSGTPGPIKSSSSDTGYVFEINGDASISVLTDNPWITITGISPSSVTQVSSTFTVVFQSDTAGAYTIRANSDFLGTTGTELQAAISIAESSTNTSISSSSIDINNFARSAFVEGNNKIFVLVTDAQNRVGHTAVLLSVDRPPEAVSITETNFGNQKVFITFNVSPDADVKTYSLFAQPAPDQTNPDCSVAAVTFLTSDTISGSVEAANCGNTTCRGGVENLTNDIAYCVAIKVVDAAGNESPFGTLTASVSPEQTVGPAGFLGEASCSLNTFNKQKTPYIPLSFIFLILGLFSLRLIKKYKAQKFIFVFFLLLFIWPNSSYAAELTPQNWTLEVKGNMMIPTNTEVKNFLGVCCSFGGEVEFGLLLKDRYNFTITAGAGFNSGSAVGVRSGGNSGDDFSLLLFPLRFDFIYRFDFKSEQLILPYIRTGVDTVFFREKAGGDKVQNVKYGVHAGVGVGILLDRVEELGHSLESEMGVNDIYLIVEGRYAMINSFKSGGLDLSGFYPYVGVLFEF